MTRILHLLSAGAAQGLVKALQADFERRHGCRIEAVFGAVGALKEALLAGEPCDLVVLSDRLVDGLVADGRLRADARAPLGRVRTGLAVPAGRPRPDVATPDALRATLLAADAIYFPDPLRATAGIHFAQVMDRLGVHDTLRPRLHSFANGATAMAAMAQAALPTAVGCTQVSEILYTPGVDLVAVLPPQFELATLYSAALVSDARAPDLASLLLTTLVAAEHQALRAAGGFEP